MKCRSRNLPSRKLHRFHTTHRKGFPSEHWSRLARNADYRREPRVAAQRLMRSPDQLIPLQSGNRRPRKLNNQLKEERHGILPRRRVHQLALDAMNQVFPAGNRAGRGGHGFSELSRQQFPQMTPKHHQLAGRSPVPSHREQTHKACDQFLDCQRLYDH